MTKQEEIKRLMEEGYKEMAEENLKWAEMVYPLICEMWPEQEPIDRERVGNG